MLFSVGLDISFRSPGMCIYDVSKKYFHHFAFASLKRDVGFTFRKHNACVKLFPPIPTADVHAYLHIEAHFFEALGTIVPIEARANTKVAIEAYVHVDGQAGEFQLHEVGGICKRQLEVMGFHDVATVVPSAWKCHVTGHGSATKLDIVRFVATAPNGPQINMLTIFGYDESKLPLDEKKRPKVPTPPQDLADSTCLAMFLFVPKHPKPKPPKRKRANTLPTPPATLPAGFVATRVCADAFQREVDQDALATYICIE